MPWSTPTGGCFALATPWMVPTRNRSMFLLRESDRSVTEICFDGGFTSLGTFSRTFRAIVGQPPAEYRRRADVVAVPRA